MTKTLKGPFTREVVSELRVGDHVAISGRIHSGRDRYHRYLSDGGQNPVDLHDGCIFHCGPVVLQAGNGWEVLAAGPTTSVREELYMAGIVEREGVRLIVGKGGMGEQTRQACIRFGCIYVQAVGGAAALVARCVRRVHGVHFLREFGSAEAVWEMDVEGMEGIVTMDTAGGSLYDQVLNDSLVNLRKAIGRCPRVVR